MTEMDQNDPDPASPQKPDTVSPELLRQLRELVWTYQSVGQVEGAVYWADKVVSLSNEAEDHPEDVYSLGQALISAKQYHRAATIAMRNNLHKSHVGCCYVAAKVRIRQLGYIHHLNSFRPFTWSTRAKRRSTLSRT